ncbi:MAG: acyltransferase, partial [Actinobacteria bacterium]|nr:acyltransferase [Actinomycetota bacterium]
MTTTTPDAVAPESAPGERAWVLEKPSFGYKPALDGLRAVAVMSVVAYHFGAGWMKGGFLGVDMFFVLSGYLITSLLLIEWAGSGTIHFGGFWARRFRRLLPALFVLLVAVALWGRLVLDSDQWHELRWDGIWSLFYAANWRFVVAGTSYFSAEPSMLRHMWSLAIEEQFYLVWPLVVFGALWLAKGRHALLTGICVAGSVASVAIMQWKFEPGQDPSRVYYGTDARASQLLIGALLAILLVHWAPRARASRLAVQIAGTVGAVFVLFLFWAARDQNDFLYRGGFILFAVAVAAVITAIVQPTTTNPMKALLCVPAIRWIGQVSYGVYLWHWPVWVALSRSRLQGWGWDISGWPLSIVQLAVTFGIAALSYYLVELPIRHRKYRKKVWASTLVFAGFGITLAVIVVSTLGATANILQARPGTVLNQGGDTPVVTARPGTVAPPTQRILVLGDSVAASLGDALAATAAGDGVTARTIARLGCGMTTGITLNKDGSQIPWSPDCAKTTVDYQQGAIADVQPDSVLWLSTWELADYQTAEGQRVRFDTPAHDRWLLGEMDRVRQTVASAGGRLVMVTNPPMSPNQTREVTQDDLDRTAHGNALMAKFAERHPDDVVLLDLASIVCPDGATLADPCSATRDGIVLRPKDGGHFEPEGAQWAARRLLDALYADLASRA